MAVYDPSGSNGVHLDKSISGSQPGKAPHTPAKVAKAAPKKGTKAAPPPAKKGAPAKKGLPPFMQPKKGK